MADRTARPYDRDARRAERARRNRLARLPFLYEWSLQGSTQLLVTSLLQIALVLALGLVPVRLATGEWISTFSGLAVLAAGFVVQSVDSYVNAKAGRA